VTERDHLEPLTCSRCERETSNLDEIAGSWFAVGGAIVCPTCTTLDDLRLVQDAQEIVCLGCGTTREPGDPFWRAYELSDEQAERTLLDVDPGQVSYLCEDCEDRVLMPTAADDQAPLTEEEEAEFDHLLALQQPRIQENVRRSGPAARSRHLLTVWRGIEAAKAAGRFTRTWGDGPPEHVGPSD
jgi:hypothetical protein